VATVPTVTSGGKDLALIHGGRRLGVRVDFDGDAPYSRRS
jgi:hypothetical protein